MCRSYKQLALEALREGSLLGVREALLRRSGSSSRSLGAFAAGSDGPAGWRGRQGWQERWHVTGDHEVVGILIPARPLLSLVGAGGHSSAMLKGCLREMHFDHCAVAVARLQLSFLLQVRGLLRTLHERVATLMDSFMIPLRGLSHSLITPVDLARVQGCLPSVRESMSEVLRHVDRTCRIFAPASSISAHRLQEAVIETSMRITCACTVMARYASTVHQQTMTLRALLTRNQLLQVFLAQVLSEIKPSAIVHAAADDDRIIGTPIVLIPIVNTY